MDLKFNFSLAPFHRFPPAIGGSTQDPRQIRIEHISQIFPGLHTARKRPQNLFDKFKIEIRMAPPFPFHVI